AVGMGAVVGLVWVMSARVLGYPKALSIDTFHRMSTIALWGFAMNAVSGFLIFSTEATRVIVNTEFQIKMACILLGGLAAWYMLRSLRARDPSVGFPLSAKFVAVLPSVAWFTAIVYGRQFASTTNPPF